MVNTLSLYKPLLQGLMKLAGVRPRAVEIEPGTVIHFWVPSETTTTSKPAVVFLHGFGLDGILTWQFQVLALAKKYAVYVPDLLFFGDSITDKTERSPAFQAECMAKGLRKLRVEKCTLVGLSYGGIVGFKMAEMFPVLVDSMVITCSVMALTESITCAGLQRIGFSSWADYLIPETVEGVKKLLDFAFYKLPWIPDFVYRDILEALYFDHKKERHELLEASTVKDEDFTVPSFTQRIYLLWGGDDIIFDKEEVRNLKELLEGKATEHCIERAGHLVELECPLAYNRTLKQILASIWQGKITAYNINRKERVELLDALIVKDKDFCLTSYPQNMARRIHLLWGEEDVIFNMEVARNLQEKLLAGKAPLHYIEKAGHGVPLERPFAYNRQLKKILDMFINHKKERVELLEALQVKDKDFYIPHYPRIHLLWGEEDVLFTMEIARNLKERLLGGKATLHYVEKAGHVVPSERPCAYNRQLKKILASLYAN
ncbi:LOW QUALITY PROTEIN: hypothetical protein NC651_022741 [Populus alba x Populus x berolinensis]|nr:LOW QUALITY PROTEIN: hypothetical protein NC651_022741 [Populus alba x Populus x berolinensis]